MLTRTLLLALLTLLPQATIAVIERHEVVMFATHKSQCTRGNSKCVRDIQEYVADYFTPPPEAGEIRRDLWTCTAQGQCDSRADDFLLCVFYNGCEARRYLQGNGNGNGNQGQGQGNGTPDLSLFIPSGNEYCYLAGEREDEAFKNDIILDLGEECPCVENTNFYVRVCEYPDQ